MMTSESIAKKLFINAVFGMVQHSETLQRKFIKVLTTL